MKRIAHGFGMTLAESVDFLKLMRQYLMMSNRFVERRYKRRSNNVLVINTDIKIHKNYAPAWTAHELTPIRVSSMHEAIKRLIYGEVFLFIIINEDTTHNLLYLLGYMRDATDIPILILTSKYSITRKLEALKLGADMYDQFSIIIDENVSNVLLSLKLQYKWANRRKNSVPMLIGGNIILSPSRRAILIKGKKVRLPRKEFEVLQYLMENKSHFVEYHKILHDVWNEECDIDKQNALWIVINRLRSKLAQTDPDIDYIKKDKFVGYMFSAI